MVVLGLLSALACAVAYGVATVLQAVGSRRLAAAEGLDLRFVARLVRSVPYLLGLALDGAGFLTSIVALRSLPLFLVQSAIASSVGVTALVAWRWLGTPLHSREAVALAGLGAGLVMLAVAAEPGSAHPLPAWAQWAALFAVLPMAALAAASSRWPANRAAGVLAALAGLGFGGVGVAARAISVSPPWWHSLASPLAWALAAHGVLGVYCFAAALQRGSAVVVSGVTFGVETVVPALIGLAFLGDAVRPGFGAVAAAGMILTLLAAVALSRATDSVEHRA